MEKKWENSWNMLSGAFSITQLNIRKMVSLSKSKASHLHHLDPGVGMQWFKSMIIISAGQTLKTHLSIREGAWVGKQTNKAKPQAFSFPTGK